jgi:hypothetical protein
MYNFVNCLQFNIRYEKVDRPAPVGGALVKVETKPMTFISLKCKSRTKPVTVVYLSTFDGHFYSNRISPLFWPARDINIWY